MNPSAFSELLTDISDEYIVSAASPHVKSIHWYQVTAIAAGIVLLLAAAVYPKLRMQMPEVTEPPVMTAVTTAAGTTVSEQTTGTLAASAKVQTTEARTSLTRTQTTATVNVDTTAVTTPEETAVQPTETAPPDTDAPATEPVQTECSAETTVPKQTETAVSTGLSSAQTTAGTTAAETQPVTVPVWRGSLFPPGVPSDVSEISCSFQLCSSDISDRKRKEYGIPQNYDLRKHQCLLIEIQSGYTAVAVLGGELTPEGLVLNVAFLNQNPDIARVNCAIPLPDDFTVDPKNCRVETVILTGSEEFQEMRVENPVIEIKEQEVLS